MQKLLQDSNIGQNIQHLRKLRGLSQYDMERELNIHGRAMSRAQYSHIEQGRANIYVSDLILIKKILKVEFADFFEGLE